MQTAEIDTAVSADSLPARLSAYQEAGQLPATEGVRLAEDLRQAINGALDVIGPGYDATPDVTSARSWLRAAHPQWPSLSYLGALLRTLRALVALMPPTAVVVPGHSAGVTPTTASVQTTAVYTHARTAQRPERLMPHLRELAYRAHARVRVEAFDVGPSAQSLLIRPVWRAIHQLICEGEITQLIAAAPEDMIPGADRMGGHALSSAKRALHTELTERGVSVIYLPPPPSWRTP